MATITATLPTDWVAPIRGVDSQEQFSLKANNAWVKLRSEITPQTNLFGTQANSLRDEVNGFRAEALLSKNSAAISATTATTQAGIATSRANEALASKNSAEASATTAITQANIAKEYADSIEPSTLVKLTGNQTIEDVKNFTSSPIVPVPTTNFQPVPLKSTNITVDVGVGQTYTTINQALEYLSGFYPMYKKSGVSASINLKAGFVMAEQVLVSGIDLGWIRIQGEDAETIITHTSLTTGFGGTHYPAFGVNKGGTSPVIGQLFRFDVEKVGGSKYGLMASGAGSSADVLSGKGFIGAGDYGIYALYGSTINASGANCSNAGATGIFAHYTSTIHADGANCSNAGSVGIYAHRASTISASGAIVQNQTTGSARVLVQDGSHIEATAIITTGGTSPVFNQTVNTLTSNGIIYQ